jgi:S1-C subfamily serine protease
VQLQDGREYEAEKLLPMGLKDLALLRIRRKTSEKPFKPISFAKDDDLLLGETVIAVGNPFGLGGSVSRGILSSKNRRSVGGEMKLDYQDWLQTDADINPGNSGGPLINTRGELIGINVAVVGGQKEGKGTGFAIPVKQISEALSDFFTLEWMAKLWLGARFRGASDSITVREVQPNSPADRAGLKVGQQVLEVNGKPVRGLIELILNMAANSDNTAKVTVSENGREKTLKVEMITMDLLTRQMILARLGLTTQNLTTDQSGNFQLNEGDGLMVTEVQTNSPAAVAKLQSGIVLLGVDGFPVFNQVRVTNALGKKKTKEKAVLTFKILNRTVSGLVELRVAQLELPVR